MKSARELMVTLATYAVAIGIIAVSGLLQYLLFPFPSAAPFLMFYFGVAWAALLGGRGPGLLAAIVAAAAGNFFFAAPLYEFTTTGQVAWATVIFVPVTSLTAFLVGSLRLTYEKERKIRKSLEASEERLRLAQSATSLGIYDHDLRTGAVQWDEQISGILGISACAPITWEQMVSCIHADDRERLRAALHQSYVSERSFDIEYRLENSCDGLEHWIRTTGRVAFENRKPIRHVGTMEDITARKRDEKMAATNSALLEADRRKNEFLAVLSHELRNPLAPIRNSVYILERAAPGGEQAVRARQVIDRQAQHMARLIEDLLDVTRISRGKVVLQRERVDLNAIARGTAEDHRETFARNGVYLQIAEVDQPLWIIGDRTRLAQVIGNLLTNATKFTPGGGKTVLTVETSASHAVVRVRDNGAGMSAETQEHLFEPFVQGAQTIERTHGGLGLGLALVKGLVELHGGTVIAHSEGEGRGSEFVVTLPLHAPQVAPTADGGGSRVPQHAEARRVLVVEDNVDSAESLREALSLSGHEMTVAYSGSQGLEAARANRPDVILCDIGLPGIDGYELARAIRWDSDPELRRTFLVALSGYALPEDVAKSREAGFDRHIAKPPSIDALEKVLNEATEQPDHGAP